MTRVLLVDGTNNFVRNYMVNTSTTENSIPCGGVVGFLNSLVSSVSTIKPDKIIIAWDGPNGSRQKRALLKEYKNGRKPRVTVGQKYSFQDSISAEKNKEWQQNVTISLLKNLPVTQIVTDGYEADDALGYICENRSYFNFSSCVILTSDKDYYQLLNQSVAVFDPIKNKLITKEKLLSEAETHPDNWLFYKAIVGDKSDNVKGVKGIGDKTIKKIFEMKNPFYFEDVLNDSEGEKDHWRKKKLEQLKDNLDLIKVNMRIMNLRDPMISITQKDTITSIVEDSVSMRPIDLRKQLKELEIPINPQIYLNFSHLKRGATIND